MGAHLVSLALARWTHLPDRTFRVLVRMALTALDEPTEGKPAAIYFGGRDLLASVLRNERGGDQETTYRTVKRALADLLQAKAIERAKSGRAGSNAVYRLTLGGPASIDEPLVDNPPAGPRQGDTSGPPQGDTRRPPQGDTSGPIRGTPGVPPRNQEEPREEPIKEPRVKVLTVEQVVDSTGGTLPPDPLRTDSPPSSGRRIESTSSISSEEQQPPQPETATHDRAREADTPAPPGDHPARRIIDVRAVRKPRKPDNLCGNRSCRNGYIKVGINQVRCRVCPDPASPEPDRVALLDGAGERAAC